MYGMASKQALRNKYAAVQKRYENDLMHKHLSINWFGSYIGKWYDVIDRTDFRTEARLKMLEIGSFEGNSSCFILETFPNSSLTCVDTWAGSDEHKTLKMSNVEQNFDANTAAYVNRLTKFKGTSLSFFERQTLRSGSFDFIYVDGSHYIDDVLIDALCCFSLLKVGGLMIFDDYLSVGYEPWSANPALAINTFVRLKRKYLKVISAYGQLVVLKTRSEDSFAEQVSIV